MDEDHDRYLVHYRLAGWSYDCIATLPTLESAQRFQTGLTEEGISSWLEILPHTLISKRVGDGNWHALVQEWEPERYSVLLTYFPTNAHVSLSGLTDFPLALQMIELATATTSDVPSLIAVTTVIR
ncbi:MAG: hypothetical protein IPL78_19325 [Chloroflexi bacterium]|nr:hypothetical protein [Chloroflexota bacterium]